MMKNIFLLTVFIFTVGYAQAQSNFEENNYIPKILPSSPTTASLMKFEEIPVDNYTGVPDISIPITSLNIDGELNLNVSLKYHPASIAVEEKASDVGLGWNLIAGGTITRTVRGLPDEYKFDGKYTRRGIYRKNETSYPNRYGEVYDILKNEQFDYDDLARYDKYNEFAWESYFKGTYDSQYDLYQYNFFGNTGRFIVKRNDNGQYNVVKLDENNLKIQSVHNAEFAPTSFIITDENGYIYTFDIVEFSDANDFTSSTGWDGTLGTSVERTIHYNSAFHLSRIEDANSRLLLSNLFEEPSKEIVILRTETSYSLTEGYETGYLDDIRIRQCEDQIYPYLNPPTRQNTNNIISYTRKLKEINIIDKAKVKFEFETGRYDKNLHNSLQSRFLKKIIVNDSNSQLSKSYVLSQQYRGEDSRMFLSKVDVFDSKNAFVYNYKLSYQDHNSQSGALMGKDYWGYLNERPIYSFFGAYREVTPGATNTDVLSKMTLPTSGSVEFTYENNTYSYNSAYNNMTETLTNWDDNINNWDQQYLVSDFNQTDKNKLQKYVFTLQQPAEVSFIINNSFGQNGPSHWQYLLFTSPTGSTGSILVTQNSDTENRNTILLQPGTYYLKLSSMDLGFKQPFTSTVNILYRTKKSVLQKYLFGGGIRIKKISYKDTNNSITKEVEYGYQNLENAELSSGALAVPKPIYTYKEYPKKYSLRCIHTSPVGVTMGVFDYAVPVYDVITTSSIVPSQKLKGEIGYKNVIVKENGKGQQNYTYSSPIDIPNNYAPAVTPPIVFFETPDYKRGLLKTTTILDDQGHLLKNSIQEYSYVDHIENIGITYIPSAASSSAYYSLFKKYNDFLSHIRGCVQHSAPAHSNTQNHAGDIHLFYEIPTLVPSTCAFYGGETPNMVRHHFDNEIVGKANVIKQEDTEFFQSQNSLKTVKDIQYNNLNYPVRQKTTFPDETSQEVTYQYAHERGNQKLINANMIGIPLETMVVKKQNANDASGKIILKKETKYDNPVILLPTSVLSYDLQNIATTEVTYDKYDPKGNLQQYTTKDGTVTVIIWGYNQTKPIAKIESIKFESISQSFIDNIVNASDLDGAAGLNSDETNLLNAFKTFRANLPGYQISTYTYDPLVGIRSITPPSGITEYYHYDSANRLDKVTDANGKILKEMKYNYKN